MRHSTILGAALATLLLSTPTHAFQPTANADDSVAGVEWVRQRLESGFAGAEMAPADWSDAAGQAGSFANTVTLESLQDTETRTAPIAPTASTVDYSVRDHRLSAPPTAAQAADGTSMEEVVAVGVRPPREPQWQPPIVEEPENDWHRRDGALRTDTGRIAVGRAVIYQDLSDRLRYDRFRDEYLDPRPHQSMTVGFGQQRGQD